MPCPPLRRTVLSLISGFAAITVCSRNSSAQPSHPPPATQSSTPQAPTPNLDALASIKREIPGDWSLLTMNLYPLPAGLEFSSNAAPDEKPKLIAFLEGAQPTVRRAIESTTLALEPFPPLPELGTGDMQAILRHPNSVLRHLARLLLTDASRCVEARDLNGAFVRISAALRLAATLNEQPAMLSRLSGSSIIVQSCSKIAAIVDAGGADQIGAEAAAELRAELSRFDHGDPVGVISTWERDARASAVECRTTYAVRGGPMKYAEYIRSTSPNISGIVTSFGGMYVEKSFANRAAELEPAQIGAALDRAEAMIPDIVAALTTGESTALERAMTPAREDPTQVARLVVGGAPMAARTLRDTRAAMDKALAAADKLPR